MIYNNFTNRLNNIISESRQRKQFEKGFNNFNGLAGTTKNKKELIEEQRNFNSKIQLNTQPLSTVLNKPAIVGAKVGSHPDFIHLKGTDQTEYHYIVSVFIDIQGSTNLHREYELEDIYRITNTIQSAAIHTCLLFGGHVQRLEGDGVFAYFGGKNISKEKAVESAASACSMFTYFVENDLPNIFSEEGIENIKTKIGIDFGNDDDVLWANFGLLDVSELTTLSLHTSLASKMQAYANRNGIVVGQNVKDRLRIDEGVYDLVKNSKGEIVKRYIFEDSKKNFRYTQYSFNWYKFLKTLPFIKADASGKLHIIEDNAEEERIKRLRNATNLISTGNAFLDKQGNISNNNSGVHHQTHRFHYGQ
jgi:class 3 adenylate cyclase